ncbi:putative RhuM-like cytoplasmic protein [Escherichia coli]|nr:putative RhuM-like cytoplasmic protein [Escherichia coli]
MGVTHLSNTYKLFKINALILIFDSCDLPPKCLFIRSPTPRNTVNPDILYCSIFNRLQEYLVKGFVMDDERLKNPPVGSSVLERIRDIRASMRRVYLQVIFPPADSQPTVSPLR